MKHGLLLSTIALFGLGGLAAESRADHPHANSGNRPITALEVTVEDLATHTFLAPFHKGDTIVIAPGQTIRLRMTAIIGSRQEASHYPSTRFTMDASSLIQVDKINEEVGSIILTGRSPHRGPGSHTVMYKILDQDHPIDDKLRTGRIAVRVEVPAPAPVPTPTPQVVTTPTPPRKGVTLYGDEYYRGQASKVFEDQSDVRYSSVGNDRMSSIRVDEGCRATLYSDIGFQGSSTTIDHDAPTMDATAVGNDAVSSIRVACDEQSRARIILYSDANYRGVEEVFYSGNYDSLSGRGIGSDHASSLRVDPGCRVVLFRDDGFRGASQTFDGDSPNLDGTPVGNDSVSSLQVSCD